ncbi:hypothetical protein FHT44_006280 [Mycolicibacterium sp. BK634]|uniref:ComEC/Rec2 family competence protein n=1 Tax=Mycolicibacterium sp. BK634 TaxID=2587099 RepID=UPI001610CDF3|nr:MBL fold metallo-hydrolase [Mycolicibacterium sp. BK634]MBB3753758.1 hypothetical protein [Mycolicibacterium sp. BK634]
MLAIDMLPGGHGDALIIEYGHGLDVRRVLVDGGTVHSWEEAVRPALLKRLPQRRLEAFVVTHVDEDHIGGCLKLLKDPDLRHLIGDVWFNGYIHCNAGSTDDALGPVDGERLTSAIREGQFTWNRVFPNPLRDSMGGPVVVPTKGELPSIALSGGAVVRLLSPAPAKLETMARKWASVVEEAGIVKGEGTDIDGRPPPVYPTTAQGLPSPLTREWLESCSAKTPPDRAPANGSSIAFLFEFDGHRALLGADAHPGILCDSLRRFAKSLGVERVPVDLVKLPHHGSKGNVTSDLIGLLDCGTYLISTNGDVFGHPDAEAIARIICASSQPPTFYCNYRTPATSDWERRAPDIGAQFVLPRDVLTPGLRVEV